MNKDNKSKEIDNTDKKLHISDVIGSLCPRCKNGTIMNNDMWCSDNKCGNYPINYR